MIRKGESILSVNRIKSVAYLTYLDSFNFLLSVLKIVTRVGFNLFYDCHQAMTPTPSIMYSGQHLSIALTMYGVETLDSALPSSLRNCPRSHKAKNNVLYPCLYNTSTSKWKWKWMRTAQRTKFNTKYPLNIHKNTKFMQAVKRH